MEDYCTFIFGFEVDDDGVGYLGCSAAEDYRDGIWRGRAGGHFAEELGCWGE